MMLALTFWTPLLLLGLLAAAIPFVLHLLSSIKAQEVYFPTLRFLRRSMEKTARRRRIQHWLLLLLRAGMLALLALAVAEPISEAVGGWLSGKRYVAAVVLDNSLSMSATDGGASRFAKAKNAARSLLHGEDKPTKAALLITNGAVNPESLTGDIGRMRKDIAAAAVSGGRAPLLACVQNAVRMFETESDRKSIFIFSDLQRISFQDLISAKELARAKDVHMLIVNTGSGEVGNVGISDLEIDGQRIKNSYLTFTATLVNSSVTDRVVDVGLRVEGQPACPEIKKTLRRAGAEGGGHTTTVRFRHRFGEARAFTGEVYIAQNDDLKADNVRRFHVKIGGPVSALVVRGGAGESEPVGLNPAVMLDLALNPYMSDSVPWPIKPKVIDADQFASTELHAKDIVFFCEVASLSAQQAGAVAEFAHAGGTVVFFLGPSVDPENYNKNFLPEAEGGGRRNLLPGRILTAVGQIGPEARARFVERINMTSPFLKALYDPKGEAGYRSIQVQRYFRLKRAPDAEPLLTLDNNDDLVLMKHFGKGKVVLCGTTASPRWTTLSLNGLFLPMINRMSLLARQQDVDQIYSAGAKVTILPEGLEKDSDAFVHIIPPAGEGEAGKPRRLKVAQTDAGTGVVYTAHQIGTYTWEVVTKTGQDQGKGHSFVVNPDRDEIDLRPYEPEPFVRAMGRIGLPRVYVGSSLEEVDAAASEHAQGRRWWDLLLAVVIIVLVIEAAVANRSHKTGEDVIPEHLNVRLAA